MRLIVGIDRVLDETLLAELERSIGAGLDLVSVVRPGDLYVLSLSEGDPSANAAQSDCVAATERLRRDRRVRSVDIDVRRQPQRP